MDRLTQMFRLLALFITVIGLVCLYLDWQPTDLDSALTAITAFSTLALANFWVWVFGASAVGTITLAWLIESLPGRRPASTDGPKFDALPISGAPEPAFLRRGGNKVGARLSKRLRGQVDVPAFVDELLTAAVSHDASDIHVKPTDVESQIAWRVGGDLAEIVKTAKEHHELIVRRLKILAQLVTYQTDMPQDGHFKLESEKGRVDVRLSTLPTRHGEKVVLRLSRAGHGLIALDRLGMPEAVGSIWRQLLTQRQGLIVLTGPTGCGKTTTLYASLAQIHQGRGATTSIATLEDPVEIDLPYLSQTQVDPATGLTFAASLRAVLRQDPNVLMIGEIRDAETAHIAVEAGLTGHLILTTLHANSTAGVFNRLIELNIEPYLASSSVLAALSQRLARRLCLQCRQSTPRDADAIERLLRLGATRDEVDRLTFYTAPGCMACEQTGFEGRIAIYELLRLTPNLRDLIASGVGTHRVEEAAQTEGMVPLWNAALHAAAEGHISLDEALRVAG